MNPCTVTIDIFGEPSSFECSSREVAVSITDVFQLAQSHINQCYSHSIDSDIDHEVDYSFHETLGAAHDWL